VTAMAGRPARVLLYVQHLLGIGHLKRTATIARAARREGLDVRLVSGGHPVPGLDIGDADLVQLPPMRAADRFFKVLVDEDDNEIDDAFKARRRALLLECLTSFAPDVLVTELFPFGRRQLRYELLPLLDASIAAKRRPAIVCSVRDILVEPPRPERIAEMLDLAERYYDAILVHGDPDLIPFGETFPPVARIDARLRYTGYVVDAAPRRDPKGAGAGEVIVSAGGGAVSEALFGAAMGARERTRLAGVVWRLLAGHALPETDFQALCREAPPGVVVERARADFTTLLANSALSISQGGYNTVMEVMSAHARGVIVPYAGGLETEQTLRAQLLRRSAGLQVVEETAIDIETIARAAEAALDGPPADAADLDTGGASQTARFLAQLGVDRAAFSI